MKIQFDPKQQYQLDAVNAVVDLFDGQPLEKPDFSVIFQTMDTELFAGQARTELGVGNNLLIYRDRLLQNLRAIQERNDLDLASDVQSWEWDDGKKWCPHFSVEMETGTGKTYVNGTPSATYDKKGIGVIFGGYDDNEWRDRKAGPDRAGEDDEESEGGDAGGV